MLAPAIKCCACTPSVLVPGPLGAGGQLRQGPAKGITGLLSLGFGFIEIGTLTGEAQPGNPKPRLFRLPRDRALDQSHGLQQLGAPRLPAPRRDAVSPHRAPGTVQVNIGKSKRVVEGEAVADFTRSAGLLSPLADYLVVNVSSPNTPGLRDLQARRPAPPAARRRARRVRPRLADAPRPAARQDRSRSRRSRRRRASPTLALEARARRHHRHQHHHRAGPPRRTARPRSPRRRRRALGCAALAAARSRSCGACARGPATPSAHRRRRRRDRPTMRGGGSAPARRWCRGTPASLPRPVVAAPRSTASSRLGSAWPELEASIEQAIGADA